MTGADQTKPSKAKASDCSTDGENTGDGWTRNNAQRENTTSKSCIRGFKQKGRYRKALALCI